MVNQDAQELLEKVIQAHGGAGRRQKLAAVEAVISARGFLFTAKRRPVLKRVRVRASIHEPRFIFYDTPPEEGKPQSSKVIGKLKSQDPTNGPCQAA